MLNFRKIDYHNDIDEIVELLNANFETIHTKEAFLWKHFENPFGKSYGLLAVDKDRIVGLRMFMRWEFLCNQKTIKAIRPVDTCTDHDYRGRGLFKKLTLEGLENIKNEYDLIFNTPNENSKPGYLKMGWEVIERNFQYKVGIINFLKKTRQYKEIRSEEIEFKNSWLNGISCQTKLSQEYFEWRYKASDYKIAKFPEDGLVIYKITKLKGIKTLVLIDIFGKLEESHNRITSVCNKNGAKAVYFLANHKNHHFNFLLKFNRDCQIVVSKNDSYEISKKIEFSVGDLEGRL